MNAARRTAFRFRPFRWLRVRIALVVARLLRRGPAAGATTEEEFGALEAQAVEKALQAWAKRQQSDSTNVPTRRIDSDSD